MFKQAHHGDKITLDLKNVMLHSQSTMDLFCNKNLVQKIYKTIDTMKLKSNGGSMVVGRKATISGYRKEVWFSTDAVTNIVALSNLIQQHRVTYNGNDMMFVVHRELENSSMEFRMHESGLHCYDPLQENAKQMAFVNTVAKNLSKFSKREVKGAEAAKALHVALERPSVNDFNWIVRSNQIKDSPVALRDVQVATSIWGKSVSKLKGSTTRTKLIPVSRDHIKIPKELLNLHREVFLTADIFFVNEIPFFLTFSRKICFTAVNHLANRTVPQMFGLSRRCVNAISNVAFASPHCMLMANSHPSRFLLSLCLVAPWSIWLVLTSTFRRSRDEFGR
jgi:hypothetical protein